MRLRSDGESISEIRRLSNVCKFLAGVCSFVENIKAQDSNSGGNNEDNIEGGNGKGNSGVAVMKSTPSNQ